MIKIFWVAFKTHLHRETMRILRIWIQTILPSAVTTMLYFLIFGTLLGGYIGDIGGIKYIDFIAPGLILMSIISNSYSNTVTSVYASRWTGYIDELVISPMPSWLIILGYVGGGVVRGLVVGASVFFVASIFVDLKIHSYGVSLFACLLSSIIFSLAGFINGLFANSFDDISIIPTFVLTPLTYLGGVFYSVNSLSDFWYLVSLINPVLYLVNAFRFGLVGVSDVEYRFAMVAILICVFGVFLYALNLMRRGFGIKI